MSALPHFADSSRTSPEVREVSQAAVSARSKVAVLFHNLVGTAEQRQRDRETKRPSGFEIDDQLDLHRLLNRQFGWPFAFKNAARVNTDLTVRVCDAVSITDQATGHSVLAKWKHRGHRVAQGQCRELLAPAIEKWITADHERVGSQLQQGCEDRIEVTLAARI